MSSEKLNCVLCKKNYINPESIGKLQCKITRGLIEYINMHCKMNWKFEKEWIYIAIDHIATFTELIDVFHNPFYIMFTNDLDDDYDYSKLNICRVVLEERYLNETIHYVDLFNQKKIINIENEYKEFLKKRHHSILLTPNDFNNIKNPLLIEPFDFYKFYEKDLTKNEKEKYQDNKSFEIINFKDFILIKRFKLFE
jgi:hypothetical protein